MNRFIKISNAAVGMVLLTVGMVAASTAFAAGGVVESPTGVAPDRYVYYPGTEALEQGRDSLDLLRNRAAGRKT